MDRKLLDPNDWVWKTGRVLRRAFRFLALLLFVSAGQAAAEVADLLDISIENLMEIEVTSVSKQAQKAFDAPAAVFVVTQDDLRRSGATSIPEALRMVPGIAVARIDNNKWAVTARGFNGRFANKLLVLIDGRSVYSPLFSGVFWDEQDVFMEDIERIEVIRGPGAALWGSNAVNGVINIITKHAKDTTGGLVTAAAGSGAPEFGGIRYGGNPGDDTAARMFLKYYGQGSSQDPSGRDMKDRWRLLHGGFRIDSAAGNSDTMTLQGDLYRSDMRETINDVFPTPPYTAIHDEAAGTTMGNVLTRWNRTFSPRSDLAVQLYYDWIRRRSALLGERSEIADLDFQNRFPIGGRQELIWGGGYRVISDRTDNSATVSMEPAERTTQVFNLFVQDDIGVIENRLHLILGSKFEHNEFTGYEVQPNGRLLWMPDDRQRVWASVARAVRTPSRSENDTLLYQDAIPPGDPNNPGPLPALVTVMGNADFASEDVIACELGYRMKVTERTVFDIAAFYNSYDDLRTFEQGTPSVAGTTPPYVILPLVAGNNMEGRTRGIEAVADWRAAGWWRLQAAYSYLRMKLHLKPGSLDTFSTGAEGESPRNQFSLRSSFDVRKTVELDVWYRYVDSLPNLGIDRYDSIDVRIAWKPLRDLELSCAAANILDERHVEFTPEILTVLPAEVRRSVYGKVAWYF